MSGMCQKHGESFSTDYGNRKYALNRFHLKTCLIRAKQTENKEKERIRVRWRVEADKKIQNADTEAEVHGYWYKHTAVAGWL